MTQNIILVMTQLTNCMTFSVLQSRPALHLVITKITVLFIFIIYFVEIYYVNMNSIMMNSLCYVTIFHNSC